MKTQRSLASTCRTVSEVPVEVEENGHTVRMRERGTGRQGKWRVAWRSGSSGVRPGVRERSDWDGGRDPSLSPQTVSLLFAEPLP